MRGAVAIVLLHQVLAEFCQREGKHALTYHKSAQNLNITQRFQLTKLGCPQISSYGFSTFSGCSSFCWGGVRNLHHETRRDLETEAELQESPVLLAPLRAPLRFGAPCSRLRGWEAALVQRQLRAQQRGAGREGGASG